MRSVDDWLAEYGESHRNAMNKRLHWICVPIIVVSLMGLLWSIPVPARLASLSPLLNIATLVMLAGVLYYMSMSRSLALGMVVFMALTLLAIHALQLLPWPLWQVCLALFVVAWIGQFIGHHVEGRRPSFFKDVQFLMIGPLWLMSFIYRRLRIPY